MAQVKLKTNENKFNSLEKKYSGFSSPTFHILINGNILSKEGIGISNMMVSSSVSETADNFSFDVINDFDVAAREFKWLNKYFVVGTYVEIKIGYVDKLEPAFYGIITAVNIDFSEQNKPVINVSGMDLSFLMMNGKKSRSWTEKNYSDVVKEIAQEYTSSLKIDSTPGKIPYISQDNESDYHFLNRLADLTNFNFFVLGRTLYFRKPLTDKTPVLELEWGKNLLSFSVDIDLKGQVSGVVVRGWDEMNNKTIESKSDKVNKLGTNSKTGKDIMKALGKNANKHIYANVTSVEEASALANSIQNKIAMQLITGNGSSIGIPELQAGRYIKIAGVGNKLSQTYYLTKVTHKIDSSGYVSTFEIGGNVI